MLNQLWFLIKVGLLVAVTWWLWQHPGHVHIQWLEHDVTLPIGLVALGLGCAGLLWGRLVGALWRLRAWPERRKLQQQCRRLEEGYTSLSQGYGALLAQDLPTVETSIQQTEKLVGDVPLLLYLKGTLARLRHEDHRADYLFTQLAQHPQASALGLLPLLEQANQTQQLSQACALAHQAAQKHPQSTWSWEQLFARQLEGHQLEEATTTLKKLQKLKGRSAVLEDWQNLYLSQFEEAQRQQDPRQAYKWAEKAYGLNPRRDRAVMAWAQVLFEKGKHDKALDVFAAAWQQDPSAVLRDFVEGLLADAPLELQEHWRAHLQLGPPSLPLKASYF